MSFCLFLIFLLSNSPVYATDTFLWASVTGRRHGAEWLSWKIHHQKQYGAQDEYYTYHNWLRNLDQVNKHNDRYARGLELYSQVLNKFADRKRVVLRRNLLPPVPTKFFVRELSPVTLPSQEIPLYVNWALSGWTSKYHCGHFYPNGWTFSAVKSLEAQIYNVTGMFTKLSRQEIFDCVKGGPRWRHTTLDAFSYIYENGVTLERLYPMVDPRKEPCKRRERQIFAAIRSYHLLQPDDEENLKIAVALIGPISVSIRATENFFFYGAGIFYDPFCTNEVKKINHAVLLVGYGTDPSGLDYWIIQNNWGDRWGDNGFGYISRGSLFDCGIASAAIYPVFDGINFVD